MEYPRFLHEGDDCARSEGPAAGADSLRVTMPSPRLARWALPDPDFWPLDCLREFSICWISLGDGQRAQRDAWLATSLQEQVTIAWHPLRDEDCPPLPGTRSLLLVSGNDGPRMGAFIRRNFPLYSTVPRVALMNRSGAQRRAQLIRAGFDDVIDVSRSVPQEALARLAVICRRYDMMRGASRIKAMNEAILGEFCDIGALTPIQRRLIDALVADRARVLSYELLARVGSASHHPLTLDCLKGHICRLRQKLRNGATIASHSNHGYRLVP